MNNAVMNAKDAAEYLNLSSSTLAKLRMTGNGPAWLRLTSRRVGYRMDDLDAFLQRRVRRSTSEAD